MKSRIRARIPGFLAAGAVLAAAPPARAADECKPARALLVLDRSSSMTELVGGASKWSLARAAVVDVSAQFEDRIDLGLMTFPRTSQCAPGQLDVAPGPGRAPAILGALGGAPPPDGNWTPMAQTLEVAATLPSLNDASRARYVVLVTDGWQFCHPYDEGTRFDPVAAVVALQARGVKTFVVGFGGAVDALALNHMAVAGGTARPGCDATSDDPLNPAPCYFPAENGEKLEAALMTIALSVSAESCDGIDNDCDGMIDEDVTRACATACGSGTETCSGGSWSACDAPPVGPEVCDGIDNDCDGMKDVGCACAAGEERPCGSDAGACVPGVQRCGLDGMWGGCEGGTGPGSETCNGVDDDCDGEVDNAGGGGIEVISLCAPGEMCAGGGCIDLLDPNVPPSEPADTDGIVTGGCACRAGGAGGLGGLAETLAGRAAVALVAAAARRRRRRADDRGADDRGA